MLGYMRHTSCIDNTLLAETQGMCLCGPESGGQHVLVGTEALCHQARARG